MQKGYLLFAIFAAMLAFLLSTSPLLHGFSANFHIDSQVYLYTAKSILNGKILYKDIFDHKGPILYLIECLGLLVSNKNTWGIWVIQYFLLVGLFWPLFQRWYKSYGPTITFSASLLFLTWIYRFMTIGDNIPELYSIAFSSYFLYIALECMDNKVIKIGQVLMLGILFACIFLIKVNLVVVVLPIFCWVCYIQYGNKKLIKTWIVFAVGNLLVCLPFLVYFMWNGALQAAFYSILSFNFSYISSNQLSWIQSLKEVFIVQKSFFLWIVVLFVPVKLLFSVKNIPTGWMLLFTFIASILVLVALPGRGNESRHYLIPMAPLVAYLLVWIVRDLKDWFTYVALAASLYFSFTMVKDLLTRKEKSIAKNEVVTYINQHATKKQTLFIVGNQSSIYWKTKLESPVKYFYTYPILQSCENDSTRSFFQQIEVYKPTWLYVEKKYEFSPCILELISEFEEVIETDEVILYKKPLPDN